MNCDCNRGIVGTEICPKCEGTMTVIAPKPERKKRGVIGKIVDKVKGKK